jgi:hypothetical protein
VIQNHASECAALGNRAAIEISGAYPRFGPVSSAGMGGKAIGSSVVSADANAGSGSLCFRDNSFTISICVCGFSADKRFTSATKTTPFSDKPSHTRNCIPLMITVLVVLCIVAFM